MKKMKIKRLVFISLMTPAIAGAGKVNLTWTAPTQRVDDSTLGVNELTGYRIYSMSGTNPSLIMTIPSGTITSTTIPVTDPANGQCITYAYAITAVSTLESALSNTIAVPLCAPKAVGSFSAQYQILSTGK